MDEPLSGRHPSGHGWKGNTLKPAHGTQEMGLKTPFQDRVQPRVGFLFLFGTHFETVFLAITS